MIPTIDGSQLSNGPDGPTKEAVMAAQTIQTLKDMADLSELSPLSRRINTATAELNAALQTIEDALNAMSLGVEAFLTDSSLNELSRTSVTTADDDDRRSVTVVELGYGRIADGWHLLARTAQWHETRDNGEWDIEDDWEETDRRALLRATRQIRVAAVAHIPKLIDALKNEAEQVIGAVENAKKIADSFKK